MSRKNRRILSPGAEGLEGRKPLSTPGAAGAALTSAFVVHWDEAQLLLERYQQVQLLSQNRCVLTSDAEAGIVARPEP